MVNGMFTIPELQEKKLIEWPLHAVKDVGTYDMILGRDVMSFLGIDILFSQKVVTWNGSELPFKPISADVDKDHHVEESMAVHTSTKRIKEILDAKCEAADLDQVCALQEHPSLMHHQQLKQLLDKCAELFDGTLGTWNLEPVELKPDATPCHARLCPILRVHQETPKMEVECLVEIDFLKKANCLEWAAPSFVIPQKDGTAQFIKDFSQETKQEHSMEAVSHSQHPKHVLEPGRVST